MESLQALLLYDVRHSAINSMKDFGVDINSHIHSGKGVSAVSREFYSNFEWYLKQIVYHKEISQFKEILQRNVIDRSIDILLIVIVGEVRVPRASLYLFENY